MSMLKGITITLLEETLGEPDAFGRPVKSVIPVPVDNVLVSPVSNDDAATEYNLSGIRVVYTLSIPKGDTHKWKGSEVIINGEHYFTSGDALVYHEALTPGEWNKTVKVYRNE